MRDTRLQFIAFGLLPALNALALFIHSIFIVTGTTGGAGAALVVTLLFASEFVPLGVGGVIAIMFVSSMVCLSTAFLMFLLEVRIATNALRIGTHRNA